MKKYLKSLAHLVQAASVFAKAIRGRDIDVGAYLVALAAVEATARIAVRFLELKSGGV